MYMFCDIICGKGDDLCMTKQNYELLIGKKFGDREILDIIKKRVGKDTRTFAVCKCKCGRVDDVDLSKLRAGRRQRCQSCADTSKNLSTGVKNISYDRFHDNFVVTIERNGQKVVRRMHSLDEAILTKKQLLKRFAKYGHFDTAQLNDSYYTQEPKKIKGRPQKDYSHLIGKKIGKWEIVSVSKPITEKRSVREVQLKDTHGNTKQINLKSALRTLKRQETHARSIKSNTGVENISYSKWLNRYLVFVRRGNVAKTGSSKTLEEAIKIKERILKEFENEAKAHD